MLSAELHLNNEDFGRLLASFRWAYALVHVPAGFLVDRIPARAI